MAQLHGFVQRLLLSTLLVAVAFTAFIGCSLVTPAPPAENTLVVPDFDNPKEQYGFAVLYRGAMIPSTDEKRRRHQVDRLIECYQRVIVNFPNDRNFTPMSRLEIADCTAGVGDADKARAQFESILDDYPENEYAQARALFTLGLMLDKEKKYRESKDIYKQVREEFGATQNASVRDIVKKAEVLYYKVRDTEKASRPPVQKKRR